MNPRFPVKEEFQSSSGSWQHSSVDDRAAPPPRPMDGLHEAGPPPFLTKTFDMVDDFTTAHIVSWSRGGHSFVGFRKIDSEKWEFANEAFLRGQKHLLVNIKRRKAPPQSPPQAAGPCVELGRFGQEGEADRLRRDKHALMMELVKLRQQQQNTRLYMQEMEVRLRGSEKKQQQMMKFLAKAMQNPDFVNQLARQKDLDEDDVSKKRRRPIEAGETSRSNKGLSPIKTECGLIEVSELEALALEIQRAGKAKAKPDDDEHREAGSDDDRELDQGFWEELLNEGFDEEGKMVKNEDGDEEEDVNVLAHRFGFLG